MKALTEVEENQVNIKAVLKRSIVVFTIFMLLASMGAMRVPEVLAQFNVKWNWSANTAFPNFDSVMTTPIVAPLYDDNHDGVVDGLDDPCVIFSCFSEAYTALRHGTICVVRGEDGSQVASFPNPLGPDAVSAMAQIAVADITLDGVPEILAIKEDSNNDNQGDGIICFHNVAGAWIPLWTSAAPVYVGGAITIADITADGIPEVIVGNIVLDSNGVILWTGASGNGWYYSAVADLDLLLGGIPEVVAGKTAYNAFGGSIFWDVSALFVPDGFVAIADFLYDPSTLYPEVVLVCPGRVDGLNKNGMVYLLDDVETAAPIIAFSSDIPGGNAAFSAGKPNGGPPVVGDFNGDGNPEIGVAGYNRYTIFDSSLTILTQFVISDTSSGVCSSSAFDFDDDGKDDIVYRDEVNLYIFSSGTISTPCTSSTGYELPTIADVDKDCRAEIVVSANGPNYNGVYVYENDYWSGTRCIWNQHTYHITNIESNTAVPRFEKNNWEYFNNYRCQPSLGRCLVAAGSDNGFVYAFDFDGILPLWTQWMGGFPVVSVAMDNDAKFIAAGSRSGTQGRLGLFDHTGTLMFPLKALPISTSYDIFFVGTESKSVDVKYNEYNGQVVAAAATDSGLYLFDQNGNQIWNWFDGHPETIVRISQDGNYIVCADYNTGTVHYFSHMANYQPGWQQDDGPPDDSQPMWNRFPLDEYRAFWVAISGHGEYVAVSIRADHSAAVGLIGGISGNLVWTRGVLKGGGVRVDMPCHWGRVVSVNDDNSDQHGCDLLCWDHTMDNQNGWQLNDRIPKWQFWPEWPGLQNQFDDFYSVSISGDGKIAAVGGTNPGLPEIFLWDIDNGAVVGHIPLGGDTVQSVDLTFTGKCGVAGDDGGNVWFFSKHSATPLWSYPTNGPIHSVAISKCETCSLQYPERRGPYWPYDLMVGCLETGPGRYAVLGYKASKPLPSPEWEMVNAWAIQNVTGDRSRASPAICDLDGDGDYDLLISNAMKVPPMGYKNIGNRTHPLWQRCSSWDVPSLGGYEQNPALADLDSDGDYDLCVAGTYIEGHDHYAAFFENTGNRTHPVWVRKPAWDISSPGVEWPCAALADLDSDGDYDLLFGSFAEDRCVAWENNGTRTSLAWSRKPAWDLTGLPVTIHKKPALVDFDSDGDYDLMVGVGNHTDATTSKIWACMNTGNVTSPTWTRKPSWDIALPGLAWIRPVFANIDGVHDTKVVGVTCKTVVCQGHSICINITITNQGDHPETFNCTISANEKNIQTETTTLTSRSSTTITFTWNTTGFARGNYTISVHAWPVPGETDTTDNTLVCGVVYVVMPGDVNADGKVDIKDIFIIARAFGSDTGHPRYNPNGDINGDGRVDIIDIFTAAKNFGRTI